METIAALRNWLKDGGVSSNRIKLSASLDWIEFNATVREAERLFMAGYHVYERDISRQPHVACSKYSLPAHINPHVDFVTLTLHFDAKIKPSFTTAEVLAMFFHCQTIDLWRNWELEPLLPAFNMLRLPSQQALKALRRPLRNPLPTPLRSFVQTRHVYTAPASFPGPPIYATLARRFSSEPNPLTFFAKKKSKEAAERGEFIDIHDVGGVDSKDFVALITDVNDNILRSDVAELAGIPYLKEATKDEVNKVVEIGTGFVYNFRLIFPCVVGFEDKAHWVLFIAAKLFGLESDMIGVTIAGRTYPIRLSTEGSHFTDINIIGADFCAAHELNIWTDYEKRTVKFYFGGEKWAVEPNL